MYQDVLCRRYYEEHVVAIFAQQMQSEYYGGNISAYIEGILLEHFSATDQETPSQYLHSHTLHAVFNLFLSDHSKQDTVLEHIALETHVTVPLSIMQCIKMCCAVDIMKNT